jgi:hypothetical protein
VLSYDDVVAVSQIGLWTEKYPRVRGATHGDGLAFIVLGARGGCVQDDRPPAVYPEWIIAWQGKPIDGAFRGGGF